MSEQDPKLMRPHESPLIWAVRNGATSKEILEVTIRHPMPIFVNSAVGEAFDLKWDFKEQSK